MDGEMIIFWWPPLALAPPYFIHLSTGVNMEDTCTQGSHALARLLFYLSSTTTSLSVVEISTIHYIWVYHQSITIHCILILLIFNIINVI